MFNFTEKGIKTIMLKAHDRMIASGECDYQIVEDYFVYKYVERKNVHMFDMFDKCLKDYYNWFKCCC